MSEPYQQLDPRTRDRAVRVLLEWAARQKDRHEPFLELLDGTTITPQDLLREAPPTDEVPRARRPPSAARGFHRLLRPSGARAWPHILNLVAVSALYGDDDIDVLLDEISGRAEAGGSAGGLSAT